MNRRGFMKGLVGLAVAAVLPFKPKAEEPVIGAVRSDPLFTGEIGRYEGVSFYGDGFTEDGGYMMTKEIAEKLLERAKPATKFRAFAGHSYG